MDCRGTGIGRCRLGLGLGLGLGLAAAWVGAGERGVAVDYQLPVDDPLPRTYLVTLAITDPDNPDWIVSTFVAGQPRTVTAENGGRFADSWDGLDENFMPVPPGDYGVKGIYSLAEQWAVDGQWHAIVPQYALGFSPWLPSPTTPQYWQIPMPFGGDPVNSPFRDVDVGANGVAVFYYQYLENGKNCPMFDLHQPVGPGQFLRAFNSGGAGGGPCVATDGETVWAFSTDGGPKFVYRADGRPFGDGRGANRRGVYLPDGWVTALAAWRDPQANQSFVYVAQRGKIVVTSPSGRAQHTGYGESREEFVDQITVHAGDNGKVVAVVELPRPRGLVVRGGRLYGLHADGEAWAVSGLALADGLPQGRWELLFKVPAAIAPVDLEVDRSGRFYLSDQAANRVYQLDAKGNLLRTFGRQPAQTPGRYDPHTLMGPGKLATWTDGEGRDWLIICEVDGPNRASEWSADSGELRREFPSYQTKANNGYAIDPDEPTHVYLPGHGGWLTRFKLDYENRQWQVDAVWPGVEAGQRRGLDKPVAIRANGRLYLASEQNLSVYRLSEAGDRWHRSAGLVARGKEHFLWHDANGNGEVDDEELRPANLPGWVLTYHGQKWLPDLSYLALTQGGRDLWRLAPSGFDGHGNPVFTKWEKLLTDPVFEARAAGLATAIHGGNELAETFSSDWMQADGSLADGFYVQARGGRNFTANFGAQHKISRYLPDGAGGYRLHWRVGRTKLGSAARRGEIEGGMRLFQPLNGLLTVVDQSRSGLFLYTDDGLYVDTLFPAGSTRAEIGVYRQPGEFFAGTVYADPGTGKIYYASGKYTPLLYEMRNWSLRENPVRRLASLPGRVGIKAAQIADPPEIAISLRGGAGKTSIARFSPALGGVALDGSLTGWEAAEPVRYGSGPDQQVEVRCLYDPEHLYLRWHVRLGIAFQAKPPPPLERIFTHDYQTDTVSFYFQGDVNAAGRGPTVGRPGDVRLVFGLFAAGETLRPVAVGMYPHWPGEGAQPQVYRTPVGEAAFAHVGAVAGIDMGHAIDADGQGFVLAVALPRAAIPALQAPFSGELRTRVNFSANLGGHNKFWWANSDGSANRETYDEPSEARLYPGAWAPALFQGLDAGVTIRRWLIAGPFGGPGAEKFSADPGNKEEVRRFFEAAILPVDDGVVDPTAVFEGPSIQGYWRDPRRVAWRPASVAELDTRVILGLGSQVWYGATWIHAPADTELEFEFQGHRMTYVRWQLNGQPLAVPEKDYVDAGDLARLTIRRTVVLQAGWNQLFFRAYNVGYVPFRLGLVLKAPPATLWPLRFANVPPLYSSSRSK